MVERFLKKGTTTIGLIGNIVVENFGLIGNLSFNRFVTDRLRINYAGELILQDNLFSDGLGSIIFLRPEAELFIGISNNTFFAPSAGINPGIAFSSDNSSFAISAEVHPKLVHFFKNSLLELGVNVQTAFATDDGTEGELNGRVVLAGEHFIQNNLSLRGEFNVRMFGESQVGRNDLGRSSFSELNDLNFQLGINYFFNRSVTD